MSKTKYNSIYELLIMIRVSLMNYIAWIKGK